MSQIASQVTITPGLERKLKNRVSIGQVIHDSLLMAQRGLIKVRRTPEQLVDVTLQPILFTVMFAYLFGGAISGGVQSYLPLLIPGILAQSVLTTSTVTGVQMREDMDKGVFDRFKSLPMARIAPLAGALLADSIRYVIATTLTFVVGYIIGYRPAGGIGGVVVAGLLVIVCAWALSWIFACLGLVARTAGSVQGLALLILFPLTFLSNAYVPVGSLPDWMQAFVKVNPITHIITAVRDLTNNGTWSIDGWWALLGAAIVVVIFAPITVRLYMRKA